MAKREEVFKKCMRVGKALVGIIAAAVIFGGIVHVLNYMYVNSEDSTLPRLVIHDLYENEGRIDNLYLGSSHVYCDINPMCLDSLSGQYNFNLSTPGQLPNGTYHLLKEADRYNDLSHVYVELYYFQYARPAAASDNAMRTWRDSDYMKLSLNKLEYMFSTTNPDQYINLCLPFTRYRAELSNWEYIRQKMKIKLQDDYINYTYDNGSDKYTGQGFCTNSMLFVEDSGKKVQQECILGENPIEEAAEKYLRKTIEYCQKRKIPITLFVAPMYELKLIATENYDNYINQLQELAQEYDVAFYDFNLVKEEYLPIQKGKYFQDAGHMNLAGADLYTPFLYEVVCGDETDNEKYFHDSYAEKLQSAAPEVYGIYYRDAADEADGKPMKDVWVASNRDIDMEYRIIITPEEGEQYIIQDFDANKEFTIPADESGICTIVARMKNSPDEVQTLEINW